MLLRTAQDVGRAIRRGRRQRGLTQQQLADQVGTTQTWISKVENGQARAQLALVLRTLTELGVRLEASFPLDPPSEDSTPKTIEEWIEERGKES